jgi:FkbM family methyltransferase
MYVYKTKIFSKIYSITQKTYNNYINGRLRTKQLLYPVIFRYNSSDIDVFSQVFIADEYNPLTTIRDVKLIVDCGANVGYSAAYFLSKFPEAYVIAVEPDTRNYELLKENLRNYGDRVAIICSAVWSHKVGLKVCIICSGEKSEWATTVRECTYDEQADLEALDISTLLNQSNYDDIDILKIDIEGSEKILFSRNFETWVNKVRTYAIELHGEESREIFYRALISGSFNFSRSGELTIAQRC